MFNNILARAVKDKVGTSKVVDVFKDAYDYIISKRVLYGFFFVEINLLFL